MIACVFLRLPGGESILLSSYPTAFQNSLGVFLCSVIDCSTMQQDNEKLADRLRLAERNSGKSAHTAELDGVRNVVILCPPPPIYSHLVFASVAHDSQAISNCCIVIFSTLYAFENNVWSLKT